MPRAKFSADKLWNSKRYLVNFLRRGMQFSAMLGCERVWAARFACNRKRGYRKKVIVVCVVGLFDGEGGGQEVLSKVAAMARRVDDVRTARWVICRLKIEYQHAMRQIEARGVIARPSTRCECGGIAAKERGTERRNGATGADRISDPVAG